MFITKEFQNRKRYEFLYRSVLCRPDSTAVEKAVLENVSEKAPRAPQTSKILSAIFQKVPVKPHTDAI